MNTVLAAGLRIMKSPCLVSFKAMAVKVSPFNVIVVMSCIPYSVCNSAYIEFNIHKKSVSSTYLQKGVKCNT